MLCSTIMFSMVEVVTHPRKLEGVVSRDNIVRSARTRALMYIFMLCVVLLQKIGQGWVHNRRFLKAALAVKGAQRGIPTLCRDS